MLKNYLVVAMRNLSRNRTFSAINILGLAIGMACCLVILLYVKDEMSYDQHHENGHRIYRLAEEAVIEGKTRYIAITSYPMGPTLVKDYPEVVNSVRLYEESKRFVVQPWFRRVIFKHCDRLTRGKQIPTVPLEEAEWVASEQMGPEEITIGKERISEVREAIENLPDAERAVVALYHIGQSSLNHVANVLALPVTTVKNRLQSARKRLRERMIEIAENTLSETGPSKDDTFSDEVVEKVVRVQQTVPFLWVSDMSKSVPFYVDGLGFEMTRKWEKNGKLRWCWLQHGGAALMVQEDHENKPLSSDRGEGVKLYFK